MYCDNTLQTHLYHTPEGVNVIFSVFHMMYRMSQKC